MNDRRNYSMHKKKAITITRRDVLKIGAGVVVTQMFGFSGSASIRNQLADNLIFDHSGEIAKHNVDSNSNFPFLIIRLHPRHHRNKETFSEVIELLKNKPGVCNEVWFCTEFEFPDLQQHRESAVLMAKAAAEIRKLGIATGLQIANTIGHGGSDVPKIMAAGTQRLVGHDGTVAPGCNCPRNEAFLDYQRQLADIYTSAFQPRSIWIDDDLRMNSHPPVQLGCYCEKCLADFSELQGKNWTREELVAELVQPEQNSELRKQWIEFGMSSLAGVAGSIAEAAIQNAPSCRMGLQECSLDWNISYGPDLRLIHEAMTNAGSKRTGSRPGFGYYTDHAPREVLTKSFGIARQVERAHHSVEQISAEIENTSHTSMGKSPRGTVIESTLHLAMGCNSLSYALWNNSHLEGPEWMEQFLKKFETWLPLWKLMAKFNENSSLGGLDLTLGRNMAARPVSKNEKSWSNWGINSEKLMQLSTTGLPLCPDSPLACASILSAEASSGLTDDELKRLFSGAVLMDGRAVAKLQERNLCFDLGVRATFVSASGAKEKLTDDSLNGSYKGTNWSQFDNSFYKLSFTGTKFRVLGEMRTSEEEFVGYSTAVFENELGGRVGVLGINGFHNVLSSAKRIQLLKMADWISKQKLPAILETSAQVVVCPRLDKSTGKLKCVTLLNTSIGETQPLLLRLRHTQSDSVTMYSAEGSWKTTMKTYREDSDLMVEVPSISPWGIVFLALT